MNKIFKTENNTIISFGRYSIFYNLGRVIPNAVLILILISKGIDVDQIFLMQAIYMCAQFLFEFPSGIISDITSRQFTAKISLVLLLITYTMTYILNGLILYLAWFIYGISAAMMTGTVDVDVINSIEKDEVGEFVRVAKTSYFSCTIFGTIFGTAMYSIIGINIYIFSIICLIIAFILVSSIPKLEVESDNKSYDFKGVFKYLKNLHVISFIMISMSLIPIFLSWNLTLVSNGYDNPLFLQIMYIIVMFAGLYSTKLHIPQEKLKLTLIILMIFAIIFGASTMRTPLIIGISGLMLVLHSTLINYETSYKQVLNNEQGSSVVSLVGTVITLLNIIISSSLSYFTSLEILSIQAVIAIYTILFLAILFIIEVVKGKESN